MTKADRWALLALHSAHGRALLAMARGMAMLTGALIVAAILYFVDTRMFPVIEHWTLQAAVREGDTLTISGHMYKGRACEHLSTYIVALPENRLHPRKTIYRIDPNEISGGQMPKGHYEWGPWSMDLPAAVLTGGQWRGFEVLGLHRCHAFWTHETIYGRVSVEMLP